MVGSSKKTVQPFRIDQDAEFHVDEFASNSAGAMSPFGDDVVFPLPLDKINYSHPTRANRPHLPVDAAN
ncbi:hypothetical protein SAMN05892883_0144 [Jatrophihabitans sp. GAS493]|uniref:hypothetical protein n=1 Tax=Jatrophihabitans sp. GAS493 TaxID=1907575 RepID=UPI000BB7642D|nr:hypothetical protein [Jatrophihabitans sp. GAS493]SOD70445.1 hypothetical protein SAMN05892883_0144 [Jatrophihabitans sp. GAS493]